MPDEMVREAQRFINTVYAGVEDIPHVEENGQTSWEVMYALTRALQYELGIHPRSNNFGPGTLGALQLQFPVIDAQHTTANITRIVQSGLYCKGYDGSGINGSYDSRTAAAVDTLKSHMGVGNVYPGSSVTPKVFKALLTMDPYVLVNDGSAAVREVQQWMNLRYVHRQNFFIIPCDGHFSRDVQRALMYAIQYEIGMSDSVANGVFGPGTQTGLRNNLLTVGSYGPFVQLFRAAMLFNRRSTVFSITFDEELATSVRVFQRFVALPVTGVGDFATWASLLVSTGDPTRAGTACDCVTEITPARADALLARGYRYVGRYLSNVPNTTLNKRIQPGELDVIAGKGLRVFPIYQTWGGSADYFNEGQGLVDAYAAINAATGYGFKRGTRIYFAVDFDALDHQVTSNIIPHFRAIKQYMETMGSPYRIGIYAPRNVCSRVADAGLTTASFVSDMSTGFSGNLGFPLPQDWAYDQISTITVGSGDGQIEIDNNIASNRDTGQNSFDAAPSGETLDVPFAAELAEALMADIQEYMRGPAVGMGDQTAWHEFTTTDCVNILYEYDPLFTSLARALRVRKALLQVPVFWEARHYTVNPTDPTSDIFGDAGVVMYHTGTLPPWGPIGAVVRRDSSTGLGQIFAATAINSLNLAIQNNRHDGPFMNPENDSHIWEVWQQLNEDSAYNIRVVPHVHFWHADLIGAAPPALNYSEEQTLRLLVRYQGTGEEAEEEGRKRLGVYRILEEYNSFLRSLF